MAITSMETRHINLSLHYLEHVIVALGEKNRSHIPYRNSMMTTLLRDSLGGKCVTAMIATMATTIINLEETLSTCRFAQRVALIRNEAKINLTEESSEADLLRNELEILKKRMSTQNFPLVGNDRMNRLVYNMSNEDVEELVMFIENWLSGSNMKKLLNDIMKHPNKIKICFDIIKRYLLDTDYDKKSTEVKDHSTLERLKGSLAVSNEESNHLKYMDGCDAEPNILKNHSSLEYVSTELFEQHISTLHDNIQECKKLQEIGFDKLNSIEKRLIEVGVKPRNKPVHDSKNRKSDWTSDSRLNATSDLQSSTEPESLASGNDRGTRDVVYEKQETDSDSCSKKSRAGHKEKRIEWHFSGMYSASSSSFCSDYVRDEYVYTDATVNATTTQVDWRREQKPSRTETDGGGGWCCVNKTSGTVSEPAMVKFLNSTPDDLNESKKNYHKAKNCVENKARVSTCCSTCTSHSTLANRRNRPSRSLQTVNRNKVFYISPRAREMEAANNYPFNSIKAKSDSKKIDTSPRWKGVSREELTSTDTRNTSSSAPISRGCRKESGHLKAVRSCRTENRYCTNRYCCLSMPNGFDMFHKKSATTAADTELGHEPDDDVTINQPEKRLETESDSSMKSSGCDSSETFKTLTTITTNDQVHSDSSSQSFNEDFSNDVEGGGHYEKALSNCLTERQESVAGQAELADKNIGLDRKLTAAVSRPLNVHAQPPENEMVTFYRRHNNNDAC